MFSMADIINEQNSNNEIAMDIDETKLNGDVDVDMEDVGSEINNRIVGKACLNVPVVTNAMTKVDEQTSYTNANGHIPSEQINDVDTDDIANGDNVSTDDTSKVSVVGGTEERLLDANNGIANDCIESLTNGEDMTIDDDVELSEPTDTFDKVENDSNENVQDLSVSGSVDNNTVDVVQSQDDTLENVSCHSDDDAKLLSPMDVDVSVDDVPLSLTKDDMPVTDKENAADPSCDNGKDNDDDDADEDADNGDSKEDGNDDMSKKNKKPSVTTVLPSAITPRRSSRNLNKQRNYSEKESESNEDGGKLTAKSNDDDDIEEVVPTDPLADPLADEPKNKHQRAISANKPIVVSDTKGLVEFATNSKQLKTNKKEPTLVIIDTNSILSGRGPIPITLGSSSSVSPQNMSSNTSNGSNSSSHHTTTIRPNTTIQPVPPFAVGSSSGGHHQNAYAAATPIRNPPQMKPLVIAPVHSASSASGSSSASSTPTTSAGNSSSANVSSATPKAPVILPSLTDDMFVVEAPSFIVPYVYEKPPMQSLRKFVGKLDHELTEARKKVAEQEAQSSAAEKNNEKDDKTVDKECDKDQETGTVKRESEVTDNKCETEDKDKTAAVKTDESESDKDVVTSSDEVKVVESSEVKDDSQSSGEKADTKKDILDDGNEDAADKKDKVKEDNISVNDDQVEEKKETVNEKLSNKDEEAKETVETSEAAAESNSENDKKSSTSTKEPVEEASSSSKKDESLNKDAAEQKGDSSSSSDKSKKPLSPSYFENPLGKFFIQIGLNLVQEHVQTDLLRSQKRKRDKEGGTCSEDVQAAIDSLSKTLEFSKENNDPFKLELKKCELCSFKTESVLAMTHHLETPHMKNYTYRCNFCSLEVRSPHDILYHMEAEHNVRGRLERAPAFHQCPNCQFEDNQKGKLTRHLASCSKKYRAERNQEPPLDWEPPAKIPRVTRNRPPTMSPGNAVYQAAISGMKQVQQNSLLPKLMPAPASIPANFVNKSRPKPPANFMNNRFPSPPAVMQPGNNFQQRNISGQQAMNQGMMFRPGTNAQTQVLLPTGYQMGGAHIYPNTPSMKQNQQQQNLATSKLLQQPSISITPLPRQSSNTPSSNSPSPSMSSNAMPASAKPGRPQPTGPNSKGNTFVICEICDGYIKDLEQLRNHMQWIHKVKIHPKMIYNRPPLNCQKCQFRFFTDQGLERHLLGSHGLVTSSMQEAANKGKDGGRCPVCGRVYQWKLLNHVARDHSMSLKPAHLSYKCTVCTATFGMYKQFESHVYSAHSVVAKRAIESKKSSMPPPSTVSPAASSSATATSQNEALLKPLKINDEITIIPQPARSMKPGNIKISPNTPTNLSTKSKDDTIIDGCCTEIDKSIINPDDVISNKLLDNVDGLVVQPDTDYYDHLFAHYYDYNSDILEQRVQFYSNNNHNNNNNKMCKPFWIDLPRLSIDTNVAAAISTATSNKTVREEDDDDDDIIVISEPIFTDRQDHFLGPLLDLKRSSGQPCSAAAVPNDRSNKGTTNNKISNFERFTAAMVNRRNNFKNNNRPSLSANCRMPLQNPNQHSRLFRLIDARNHRQSSWLQRPPSSKYNNAPTLPPGSFQLPNNNSISSSRSFNNHPNRQQPYFVQNYFAGPSSADRRSRPYSTRSNSNGAARWPSQNNNNVIIKRFSAVNRYRPPGRSLVVAPPSNLLPVNTSLPIIRNTFDNSNNNNNNKFSNNRSRNSQNSQTRLTVAAPSWQYKMSERSSEVTTTTIACRRSNKNISANRQQSTSSVVTTVPRQVGRASSSTNVDGIINRNSSDESSKPPPPVQVVDLCESDEEEVVPVTAVAAAVDNSFAAGIVRTSSDDCSGLEILGM